MRRSHNRRRSPYDISRAVVLLVILALAALLVFGAVRLLTLSTAPAPTPTPQPSAAPSAGEPEETAAQEEAPGESEGGSLYLDIAVDVENRTLQVSQQVQWVNDTGSEQEEIVFRMYPNALNNGEDTPLAEELAQEAFPNGAQTEGIVVRGAAVDGQAAEFSVDGALRHHAAGAPMPPLCPKAARSRSRCFIPSPCPRATTRWAIPPAACRPAGFTPCARCGRTAAGT